jgi:hypothetical protein
VDGERRARVRKIFRIGVKVEIAPAARRIADERRGIVAPQVLFVIRSVYRRDDERDERIVQRRLPALMSRRAAPRLESLHRQRAVIGDEPGIAKMIVLVGSFKDWNDDGIEQCKRDKARQQNHPGLVTPCVCYSQDDRVQHTRKKAGSESCPLVFYALKRFCKFRIVGIHERRRFAQ